MYIINIEVDVDIDTNIDIVCHIKNINMVYYIDIGTNIYRYKYALHNIDIFYMYGYIDVE